MDCSICGSRNSGSSNNCKTCGAQLSRPDGSSSSRQQAAGPSPAQARRPIVGNAAAAGPLTKPSSFLLPAIATTLLCCLPVGLVGVVFAIQVETKWRAGDHLGAQSAAQRAKIATALAAGLGVAVTFIFFLIGLLEG